MVDHAGIRNHLMSVYDEIDVITICSYFHQLILILSLIYLIPLLSKIICRLLLPFKLSGLTLLNLLVYLLELVAACSALHPNSIRCSSIIWSHHRASQKLFFVKPSWLKILLSHCSRNYALSLIRFLGNTVQSHIAIIIFIDFLLLMENIRIEAVVLSKVIIWFFPNHASKTKAWHYHDLFAIDLLIFFIDSGSSINLYTRL